MQSRRVYNHHKQLQRHGLSIVEFIGCLVALCGGVAMGSMYLGIDLQGIAFDALKKSQVVGFDDEFLSGNSEDQQPVDSKASTLDQEPTSKKNRLDADSSNASPEAKIEVTEALTVQSESTSEPPHDLTEEEREKATLAYWKALTACLQEEVLGRQSGLKDIGSWQLLDHLTHRLEGHQRVVDKIEQLDDNGVDQKVTFYAKQVMAWHLAGVKLNQRALDLITNGPQANLTGPVAQSWQSAATQHRMEEKLIQEKHLSVASYLAHTYKTPEPTYPPVASP